MRARQFEMLLASFGLWSSSEIDQRTRALREIGALPIGGRGLNAPDITAEHAAMILIALASTERAGDAREATQVYASMADESGRTFAAALTAALSDPLDKLHLERVTVCRTIPE